MATEVTATDGFIKVNGLRLHYLDWGNAEAPALVMLHGLRGFAHGWDAVARALCDRYHVYALDQRGRGDSDWDPEAYYHTEAYVSDAEGFVAQLALSRFVLMGHSMGGANTIVYAARHPDQVIAAVVEDIGPRSSPPAPGFARITHELDSTPESFASWQDAATFVGQERPDISDDAMARRLANALKPAPDGRITWKYDLKGIKQARRLGGDSAGQLDLWPLVRNLQCPTLLLRGARSDILSPEMAEAMAAANPRIRWVEIPDASHFVHEDNPAAFNAGLDRFLREIPP